MSSELEELYQEVILDHARRPRNFGELPNASARVHGDNPACGDEILLAVCVGDDVDLARVSRFGSGPIGQRGSGPWRSSSNARRAKIPAAGQMRHAGVARARTSAATWWRIHHFDGRVRRIITIAFGAI